MVLRIILVEAGTRKGNDKVTDKLKDDKYFGFREGNAEVWGRFIGEQIPKLFGMFIKRWPNPSLAEELVQKTIFDAVRGRGSFDASKGSCEEWIFGIARNNLRLEIRRRATRPSVDGDISTYIEAIDTELLPDEVLERRETAEMVRTALDGLETKERQVLEAKYIEGLSAKVIAGQIGISEKAVHSLLYRARQTLRFELKRLVPPGKGEQKK